VGQALAPALADRFHVIGLSRTVRKPGNGFAEYRSCDLFSLKDAEEALEGAEYAVYLVHNMMPSTRLTQGDFADLDIVCADNFARAAASAGVKQIVYLSGLCPEGELSRHLESRCEVERTLSGYVVPVTTLRAGLIIGAGGSSFQMMAKLVRRLPVMVCPSWTDTKTQPIALRDVIQLIAGVLGREDCYDQTHDIGAPEVVTYKKLMALTAEAMGKRRLFIPSKVLSPGLSRLWVSTITGAPRALVSPLIQSLKHEMVIRDNKLAERLGVPLTSVADAISEAVSKSADSLVPHAFRGATLRGPSLVRSVQRMKLPAGWTAKRAATDYLLWLPRFLSGLIRVDLESVNRLAFVFAPLGMTLLELDRAPERSRSDRQLFYVTGGVLRGFHGKPRFELRQVLGGRTLLTVVHDYEPRLPWLVYVCTQAVFHRWLMNRFAKHLSLGAARNRRIPDSARALPS
jgi:uncharacterized protein YbjT (DUF2867 family)